MGFMTPPQELFIGEDFAAYMQESEPQARMVDVEAYREEVRRIMFGRKVDRTGLLPWSKAVDCIDFKPGEVSMWAGTNNAGKSMVLGFCSLGWMRAGEVVGIASFEMRPSKLLERYAHQFCMGSQPTEQAVDGMFDWMLGRVKFLDQQGTVDPQRVYAAIRYAADKLQARHFIVDSLMKCVKGEDDYNGQKSFVDVLTSIARDTGIHIHMVHHLRKPSDESSRPTRYDAKGSGSISDQVDNCVMVWRNKPKERVQERADLGERVSANEEGLLDQPDVTLTVDKQRNGDWEGSIGLWFHKGSKQYCADPSRRMIDFK